MTGRPDFVDAHVHLWDTRRFRLAWVTGSPLERPHLPSDYARAAAQTGSEWAYVCVEAGVGTAAAVEEVGWIREQAGLDSRIRGLVANAPVEAGARALGDYLKKLREGSGGLLRGVRRDLQGEEDPDFCVRRGFLSGLRLLPAHQLTFDVCVSHARLSAVIQMVSLCPETTFVLDHLGKPAVGSRTLDPWRSDIEALARRPNVSCKISGLLTEARLGLRGPEDFAPYVEHVLAAFGEDRVMFGSDWPVVTRNGSFARWVEIVADLTRGLGPDARDKLFRRNAVAVYRLDLAGPEGEREVRLPTVTRPPTQSA